MLNVRLSRESLLFLQRNKMNARGLNPSVPVVAVVHDDNRQKICDFGFATPVAPKTRATQRKLIETADQIQGVTRLPNADIHKRFSESVLYNTPSRIVEIALEEPQSEPKASKTKVAKGKMKNSSHLLNATKTITEEVMVVKFDKKQNSKQRMKLGSKKRSAETTQEQVAVSSELADTPTSPLLHDVSQPASKRPKVFSDWDSFSTTIESVVAASAENVSENADSDQISKENLEGKTVSEARAKRLARKSTVTTGAKPVKSRRKKEELEVAGVTEQSTSLLKSPISPKKDLAKSPRRSSPITSELKDEPISKKATATDVSIESESDTCSSTSNGEEDPIFFIGESSNRKRSRIGTIISDIFGTPRKTHATSESSSSPEFEPKHKLSKSLPGLILPASRKQHSLYEHSANRDLSTVGNEKVETRKEMLAELARNKNSSKNVPISKWETSRISANASTSKENVNSKSVENGEFTSETPHLSESVTPSIVIPALKRKKSTRFPRTPSPNKQDKASHNASQHDEPLVDRDSDAFDDGLILAVPEITPTQRTIMSRADESMLQSPNYRMTVSNISAQCDVVPVPAEHPTRFNLYMAPPGYPVRARQLVSTDDFLVSWLDLEPTVIFPLQTSYRTMVMRLKGSVEFRSNPFVPSRMMVNSAAKMVELEAGRLFHIANTGDEVASIQMTEVLQ